MALTFAALSVPAAGGAQSDRAPAAVSTSADPAPLPFSDEQLQQALLARLLPASGEPGPSQAHVEPLGPGVVTVQVGPQARIVTLGERTGTAAARIVALVIAELLTSGPTAETAPPVAAAVAARPVEPPKRPPTLQASDEPIRSGPPWTFSVCLAGGLSVGLDKEELRTMTVDADVLLAPPHSAWRLAPSIGLRVMPARNVGLLDEVSFTGVVARVLAGGHLGLVDVLGGPFVSRYDISGATSHSGFLVGGEALVRLAAPLSRTLRLVAEARLDYYVDRVRAEWADGGGYATPRLGVGAAVGLAWEWPG